MLFIDNFNNVLKKIKQSDIIIETISLKYKFIYLILETNRHMSDIECKILFFDCQTRKLEFITQSWSFEYEQFNDDAYQYEIVSV